MVTTFEAAMEEFIARYGVTATTEPIAREESGWVQGWAVTLHCDGREESFLYYTNDPDAPTPDTFEALWTVYGEGDEDSLPLWLRGFLGDDAYTAFLSI